MLCSKDPSRRDILKAAAAGLAVPCFVPRSVLAAPGVPGANDRIRTGVIGCGNRIQGVMRQSPKDIQLAAISDCDTRQMGMNSYFGKGMTGRGGWRKPTDNVVSIGTFNKLPRYQDYREMLDQQKLDAAYIGTTTHARALCCIHAMQAGLDLYAEKPLILTVEEGRAVANAVKKYKTILQVGTQGTSIESNQAAVTLIRGGALGKIQKAVTPNYISGSDWPGTPGSPIPKEVNWDMWLNQAPMIPHSTNLYHGNAKWGPWNAFDCGGGSNGMTGWGTHAFEQVQRSLGKEDTGPVEIWPVKPGDMHSPVTARYADGTILEMKIEPGKGPAWGSIFIGEKGKIEINRFKVASNPPELTADIPASEPNGVPEHNRNWVECMRSRKQPNAHAEGAHRATTLAFLATIARELGRRVRWDPEKEIFPGDEEATQNRWVSRPRREGYELPQLL
ncbi:MAG: Gfo/Idh/MocA family oxidoreductase [Candidatus Nealsonbacteria bacterium]|nr:Gfo/Idh/MocA family oxidoreductase [Candidatus Nealsonbacteria bacterium]